MATYSYNILSGLSVVDYANRAIAEATLWLEKTNREEAVRERYASMLISAHAREGKRVQRLTRGSRILAAILPAARRHTRNGQQLKKILADNNRRIQTLREDAQWYAHYAVSAEQHLADHKRMQFDLGLLKAEDLLPQEINLDPAILQ